MQYLLTKSGKYNNTNVVLVSAYAPEGRRFDRHTVLPDTGGKKGGEFVRLHLLKKPGANDPGLTCEEEGKLIEFAWAFLTDGIPPEWVALADLYYELRSKGVKLPPVEVGRSLRHLHPMEMARR